MMSETEFGVCVVMMELQAPPPRSYSLSTSPAFLGWPTLESTPTSWNL